MPEGMWSNGQLSSRRVHPRRREQQGWGTSISRLRRQVAHWTCEKEQGEQGWDRWSLEFYWRETSWQGHEALLTFRFGVTSMHSGLSPQLGAPGSGVDCVCTCGCACACACARACVCGTHVPQHTYGGQRVPWVSILTFHLDGDRVLPCSLSAHTTV